MKTGKKRYPAEWFQLAMDFSFRPEGDSKAATKSVAVISLCERRQEKQERNRASTFKRLLNLARQLP